MLGKGKGKRCSSLISFSIMTTRNRSEKTVRNDWPATLVPSTKNTLSRCWWRWAMKTQQQRKRMLWGDIRLIKSSSSRISAMSRSTSNCTSKVSNCCSVGHTVSNSVDPSCRLGVKENQGSNLIARSEYESGLKLSKKVRIRRKRLLSWKTKSERSPKSTMHSFKN